MTLKKSWNDLQFETEGVTNKCVWDLFPTYYKWLVDIVAPYGMIWLVLFSSNKNSDAKIIYYLPLRKLWVWLKNVYTDRDRNKNHYYKNNL